MINEASRTQAANWLLLVMTGCLASSGCGDDSTGPAGPVESMELKVLQDALGTWATFKQGLVQVQVADSTPCDSAEESAARWLDALRRTVPVGTLEVKGREWVGSTLIVRASQRIDGADVLGGGAVLAIDKQRGFGVVANFVVAPARAIRFPREVAALTGFLEAPKGSSFPTLERAVLPPARGYESPRQVYIASMRDPAGETWKVTVDAVDGRVVSTTRGAIQ